MSAKCPLKEIKSQIEKKQGQLNKMIIADIDRDKLLKYSVELDRLIDQYYSLELNKNRTK
ncbi:MAG: Spo0E family sporulation regulatory protein-aspartic acid phosphatase [Tissierellia bacterium]|nr:Spo0E family sporulation regulatory protein-aspartic acid phosphatase [Tissierellia bacterium]